MINPEYLETTYQEYIDDLTKWVPDGIIEIDLNTLKSLGLLTAKVNTPYKTDPLEQSFHIFETKDKITLVNDIFVIWIVPELVENVAKTFTLIALNKNGRFINQKIVPIHLIFFVMISRLGSGNGSTFAYINFKGTCNIKCWENIILLNPCPTSDVLKIP